MRQVAVFVDAGYFYAAGGELLAGEKLTRGRMTLNHEFLKDWLKQLPDQIGVEDAHLLRTYWYDGTDRGPTPDHKLIAALPRVKLRLGTVNSQGSQKGVDSLLVTDLVTLAQNGSITDAILIGGDEDLRVGVALAQPHGVSVWLLKIDGRQRNSSVALEHEADEVRELGASTMGRLLTIDTMPAEVAAETAPESDQELQERIQTFIDKLPPESLDELARLGERDHIPSVLDKALLRAIGGWNATEETKHSARKLLKDLTAD